VLGMNDMNKFTNQMFCYWLQGYFEISAQPELTMERVKLIKHTLRQVTEEYGPFTSWLSETLDAIEQNNYREVLVKHFSVIIRNELYNIFVHVIDESYETDKPRDYLQQVHDGAL
jgi:CRISPR/Cas system CSM-associated protein Csm2 small subunit